MNVNEWMNEQPPLKPLSTPPLPVVQLLHLLLVHLRVALSRAEPEGVKVVVSGGVLVLEKEQTGRVEG